MHSELFINTILTLIGLLFVAAVSALVLKRIRFPYTVGLVVLGALLAFFGDTIPALGEGIKQLELAPEVILFIFIPTLIFESAFATDVRLLTKNLIPTMTLAAPGLLLSTGLIGLLVSHFTPLPLGSALIFGCLISATDPVAVIALFKDLGAPSRLNILVEGESLFNDATAIVTFQIILAVILTGILDVHTILGGVGNFFVVFFGGLIVGLGFGYLLVMAIKEIGDEPLVHITFTLVVAYGSFIIAEHFLHTSGIMAVLGAGLVVGYYGTTLYNPHTKEYLHIFWENAAFVANSLIFLMLGLSEKVFLTNVNGNIPGLLVPIIIVIAIVMIVRAGIVFSFVPLINLIPGQRLINRAYQTVMFWGGLRGAVAVALAISLPNTFPFRWQIIDFAFGVILFTLLANGTTMGWLMKRLRLNRPTPLVNYVKAYAQVLAKKEALQRLDCPVANSKIKDRVAEQVCSRYRQELEEAETTLANLQGHLKNSPEVREKLMWLRSFGIQRQTYQHRYEQGLIGLEGLRDLEADLFEQELALEVNDNGNGHALPEPRLLKHDCTIGLLSTCRRPPSAIEYEKVITLAASYRSVLENLPEIQDFAAVNETSLADCKTYYQQLGNMAEDRLIELEEQSETDCGDVLARQLRCLAGEDELQEAHETAIGGSLPDYTADRIEQVLEKKRVT